ncbi:kinase-like domain-containing protein, partial [Gamsiella multidivaricata]|uniref:kinase-like domain-containing protein n=1 Tax=Gamsiella multidivaricata TaxID=101098 RepID=UPI00221F7A3B
SKDYFQPGCGSVRYLHEGMRIVHRDIKLENILRHESGIWKVCDFGLAEYQDEDAADAEIVGGSLAYCSTEQLRSNRPLRRPLSDIWSLGVVLYAFLTNKLPFQDEYEPRLQLQTLNGRYEDLTDSSTGARDLLKNALRAKPADRWRIGQVRDSSWCLEISSTDLESNNKPNLYSPFRSAL